MKNNKEILMTIKFMPLCCCYCLFLCAIQQKVLSFQGALELILHAQTPPQFRSHEKSHWIQCCFFWRKKFQGGKGVSTVSFKSFSLYLRRIYLLGIACIRIWNERSKNNNPLANSSYLIYLLFYLLFYLIYNIYYFRVIFFYLF